ncbi:VQ motif-containing protein 11 [Sesamum alatum]|uniref:VQ motif-containing protein 11 n=1 Tax=Sesamum alatum TaxID=300844 RepID=A0AAE1YDS7_9LAMI|nr:VQ motif-containing protein 11 [Sesamum alatum]
MASSNHNPNPNPNPPTFPNGFDPTSIPNTTFVQADPSTFRAVVQRLTGAAPTKLAGKTTPGEMGPRKPAFKLHERRPTARKLEIKLNNNAATLHSPPSAPRNHRSGTENMVMVSPVSPLEYLAAARGSPTTPRSPMEEEQRAIAEKGFFLHPSPLSTPRGSDPPELLPLFPLHSPRDNYDSSSN